MPADAQPGGSTEVVCPHCAKRFTAPLLSADTASRGFKCPHCRLFVPLDRAAEATRA